MKLFSTIFAGLILPSLVLAAGLEVRPASLSIQTTGNTNAETILHIANPTADVQLFEVSADDFSDEIELRPTSFTLQSGETRDVTVSYTSTNTESRVESTFISVVSGPLSTNRLQANTGTKIPLTITVTPESPTPKITSSNQNQTLLIMAILGILAAILSLFGYRQWNDKQRNKS